MDATEREVSHIFRPFPGFSNVRLITKTSSRGKQYYNCFVEFETPNQAAIALTTLQGYKFHNKDPNGVRISFEDPRVLNVQGEIPSFFFPNYFYYYIFIFFIRTISLKFV